MPNQPATDPQMRCWSGPHAGPNPSAHVASVTTTSHAATSPSPATIAGATAMIAADHEDSLGRPCRTPLIRSTANRSTPVSSRRALPAAFWAEESSERTGSTSNETSPRDTNSLAEPSTDVVGL